MKHIYKIRITHKSGKVTTASNITDVIIRGDTPVLMITEKNQYTRQYLLSTITNISISQMEK